MHRFLITGDSWSQGEWVHYPQDGQNPNPHFGLTQYLREDGHYVDNRGRGGFNNIESLEQLRDDDDYEHIILFYTDPMRHGTEEDFDKYMPYDVAKQNQQYVSDILEQVRKRSLVTIVGGCAKYTLTTGYDYVVPSITELLVPSFVDGPYMISWEWERYCKKDKQQTFEFKQQMVEIYRQGDLRQRVWHENPELFFPDGLHANRKGHIILYEYLKNLWKL